MTGNNVTLSGGIFSSSKTQNYNAAITLGADAILSGASKRYEYEMERIGGKSNVLAAELREWFVSLWHGKRLAHTVVFLSVGGSLACFLLAHLLSLPPLLDDPTADKDIGGNG